jgi:hypothetical protein
MTKDVLQDVYIERFRQDSKWGIQNHNARDWSLILAEELGEVIKEANEIHFRKKGTDMYRMELVQVAAVAVAAIESLDRGYV